MIFVWIISLFLGQWAWCSPSSAVQARQESPVLPDRSPFGFGAQVTGGGSTNNTYVVDNMMDLRSALTKAEARTVYVKGEIKGNQINETTSGNCQYYIDTSTVPDYNFTLYLMALNETYTDAVKAAIAANETFEGRNASEYLTLLNKQNVGFDLRPRWKVS
jgi:pectate lyase